MMVVFMTLAAVSTATILSCISEHAAGTVSADRAFSAAALIMSLEMSLEVSVSTCLCTGEGQLSAMHLLDPVHQKIMWSFKEHHLVWNKAMRCKLKSLQHNTQANRITPLSNCYQHVTGQCIPLQIRLAYIARCNHWCWYQSSHHFCLPVFWCVGSHQVASLMQHSQAETTW